MLIVYAGLITFGLNEFRKTPLGFIPDQDGGYLITVVAAAASAASLARTDAVNQRVVDMALHGPGRSARSQSRRLFGRNARQCLQRRRCFRRVEAVRRARQRSEYVGESHSGGAARRNFRRSRKGSCWSSLHRLFAVSAVPAVFA